MDRIIERFTTVPLFRGLEPTEIARFLEMAENVEAHPGDVIIAQGEPGDGLYVIAAGAFDVVRESRHTPQVIASLQSLSNFGEMSLFEEKLRSATVICRTEGRLKRFPRDRFHALLDSGDPTAYRITRNILGILARRLAKIDDRLVS